MDPKAKFKSDKEVRSIVQEFTHMIATRFELMVRDKEKQKSY
jgi:hypothetical protein